MFFLHLSDVEVIQLFGDDYTSVLNFEEFSNLTYDFEWL